MNNIFETIVDYATTMNYGMGIEERDRKYDEEQIEFNEARDFNLKRKIAEEGSDVIITTVLRMIASGIDVEEAIRTKIKNDMESKLKGGGQIRK
jgi:phosphoribosyl-ATP pyrophosphohydrolase